MVWLGAPLGSIIFGSLDNASATTWVMLAYTILSSHFLGTITTIKLFSLKLVVCWPNRPMTYDLHKRQTYYWTHNVKICAK